jgi:hypothetical protein
VLPDVRSAIEAFCDMIAKGLARKEQVVAHSLRNFEGKFRYFCDHIEAMDSVRVGEKKGCDCGLTSPDKK